MKEFIFNINGRKVSGIGHSIEEVKKRMFNLSRTSEYKGRDVEIDDLDDVKFVGEKEVKPIISADHYCGEKAMSRLRRTKARKKGNALTSEALN